MKNAFVLSFCRLISGISFIQYPQFSYFFSFAMYQNPAFVGWLNNSMSGKVKEVTNSVYPLVFGSRYLNLSIKEVLSAVVLITRRNITTYSFNLLSPMKKQAYFIFFLLWVAGMTAQGQNPELRIPIGHTGQITDLQESPNGKLLASASADGTIKIWNLEKRILLQTLAGHTGIVTTIAFSANSKKIVSGSVDKTVRIWDLEKGTQKIIGEQKNKSVFVAFSPQSEYVISICYHTGDSLRVSKKGDFRYLPSSETEKTIKIWNLNTGKEDAVNKHKYAVSFINPILNIKSEKGEFSKGVSDLYRNHELWSFSIMINYGNVSKSIDLPTFYEKDMFSGSMNLSNEEFEHTAAISKKWIVAGLKTGEGKIINREKEANFDSLSQNQFKFNKQPWKNEAFNISTLLTTINQLKISANETFLITSSFFSDTLFIYNLTTKNLKKIKIKIPQINGQTLLYSSSSNILDKMASATIDFGIKSNVANMENDDMMKNKTKFWITQLSFINKDKQVALGFNNGIIKIIDLKKLKSIGEFNTSSNNIITSSQVTKEKTIQLGFFDGYLKQIDLRNNDFKILKKYNSPIKYFFQVSNNGEFISLCRDNNLYLKDNKEDNKENNRDYFNAGIKPMNNNNSFIIGPITKTDLMSDTTIKTEYEYRIISHEGKLLDSTKFVSKPKISLANESIMQNMSAVLNDNVLVQYFRNIYWGIRLSNNNQYIADLGNLNELNVVNLTTKQRWNSLSDGGYYYTSVIFDNKPNSVIAGTRKNEIVFWDWETKQSVKIKEHQSPVSSLEKTENDSLFASGDAEGTILIWDMLKRKVKKKLKGHLGSISTLNFLNDNKWLVSGSEDGQAKIWDIETGKELASVIPVDSTDWVVTSPEGWFDASPGAMQKMYYVQGLETFDLEQLKERYWVPGLLQELLGYTQNGLPPGIKDSRIPLPPNIKLSLKGDILTIKATKRDGGLGKISLFVDNIEVETDLRAQKTTGVTQGEFIRAVSLKNYQRFLGTGANILRVVAYEKSNQISTHGDTISYVLTGRTKWIEPTVSLSGAATPKAEATAKKASFYGVMIGANTLGLRYASKDAEAMKQVVEKVAKSFIDTTQGKVRIALFSQSQPPAFQPTKANVTRYLEELKKIIKPEDYFCFFYSGHGKVFINKAGENDFALLLQGIRQESTDLSKSTLSDFVETNYVLATRNELTKLLNNLPARKKIIAMDACGSESAAQLQTEALTVKQNRPNREKALDNMSSRTGVYFLASSATDKASFEHAMYEHGFLTYSLLRGIKSGAAAKFFGAEAYLEVSTWFKYAEADAPKVAASVGQIQQPKFMTPKQTQDDIFLGIVDDNIRHSVTLLEGNKLKVGKCIFHDEDLGDGLDISEKLNAQLRGKAEESSDFWYEDTEGAFSLHGSYKRAANSIIQLEINLFKGKMLLRKLGVIELKADGSLVDHLKDKLLQEAKQ